MSSFVKKFGHLFSALALIVVISPLTGCGSSDNDPPLPTKPTITINQPSDAPIVASSPIRFTAHIPPLDANKLVNSVMLNLQLEQQPSSIRMVQTEFPMTREGNSDNWYYEWIAEVPGDYIYFVVINEGDDEIRVTDPQRWSVVFADDVDGDGDGDLDGDGDGDLDGDGDGDLDGDGDGDLDGDGDGDLDGDGDGDLDGDGDGDLDGDGDGDLDGDGDGDLDGDGDGDLDGDGDGDLDGDGDGDLDGDGDGDTDGDGDGDLDGDGDGDLDGDGDGDVDGDGDGDTDGDGDGDLDGDGDGDLDGDGDGDVDGDGDGDLDGDGDGDLDGDGDGDLDGDGDGDTDGDGDGDTDGDGDGDYDAYFTTAKDLVAAIFYTLPDGSFIQLKGDDETIPICDPEQAPLFAALAAMNSDDTTRQLRGEPAISLPLDGIEGGTLTLNVYADPAGIEKIEFIYQDVKGGVIFPPETELEPIYNDQIINGTLTWFYDEWEFVPNPEGGDDIPVIVKYRHVYEDYNSRSIEEPQINNETIDGTISFDAKPFGTTKLTTVSNTKVTHNLTGRYLQNVSLTRVADTADQTQALSGQICVHDSSVETCANVSTPTPLVHACANLADATSGGPMYLDVVNSSTVYQYLPIGSNEFELGLDQDGDGVFEITELYNWFKLPDEE